MVLFRDLLTDNQTEIKSYMKWENYDLNDKVLPVVETLREHAITVLSKSYGSFHVEQTILDELCADVFIYFPILMQQLAISRLMDATGVVPEDTTTETLTRTETLSSEIEQNSELTLGTSNTDTNTLNTQQKTTGTVMVENDSSNTQSSSTEINNTSGVDSTGSRNLSVVHNMPEQALNSYTGNFPVDSEGTPVLTTSYIQNANENFSTSNPISTNETSEQNIENSSIGVNDSLTTNDLTVADTGTTTRTSVNTGSDTSESTTNTDSTNTISETRTRTETNKQYAYEIKAFLESTDTLVAFRNWEDKFSWVVGII